MRRAGDLAFGESHRRRVLLAIASLTLAGCASLDEAQRELSYKTEAKEAVRSLGLKGRGDRHFERGFVAGYTRFAMTGDAATPVVPEKEYLSFLYDGPRGRADVGRWFEGYEAGVSSASCVGVGPYVNVATGRPAGVAEPFDPAAVTAFVVPDEGAESLDPRRRAEEPDVAIGVVR